MLTSTSASTSHTATLMKPLLLAAALAAILFASGCMFYMDNPPTRVISGQVIQAETGQPQPFAVIYFYSGRRMFYMATNYGIDATATADKDGKFTLTAKLNDHVAAIVYHEGVFQEYQLPAFPADNNLKDFVFRVNKKPPPEQPPPPQKHWWQFWK